jgi:phosphoribosylformylglycinamidine cyclo-ligase
MNKVGIKGMAHITGGGYYENVPRIFGSASPDRLSLAAVIRDPLSPGYTGLWKVPPIFARIAYGIKHAAALSGAAAQQAGEEILRSDPEIKKIMFNTYNMGIGFVLALAPEDVQKAAAFLEQKGFPAWEIGRVEKSGSPSGELRFASAS